MRSTCLSPSILDPSATMWDPRYRRGLIFILLLIVLYQLWNLKWDSTSYSDVKERYNRWKLCVSKEVEKMDKEEFWEKIGDISTACEPHLKLNSRLYGFENKDETKYHMLPVDKSQDSVIITLGIGGDADAEKRLKPYLSEQSTFIGTDPDIFNHNVYREVGMFLPMTVGKNNGNTSVDHLMDLRTGYVSGKTFQITMHTLLSEYIPKTTKVVDNIWVDIEFSEYDIFDVFTKSSELFTDGYAICQYNLEVHNPKMAKKGTEHKNIEHRKLFHSFMKKVLEEEGYVFLKMTTYWGHWRILFLDFNDIRCVQKYLVGV